MKRNMFLLLILFIFVFLNGCSDLALDSNPATDGTDKAGQPLADRVPGVYHTNFLVSLSSGTPGAEIFFTTNGSDPLTEGLLYTNSIAIDVSTELIFVAKKSGMEDSDSVTNTYTLKVPLSRISPASGVYGESQVLSIANDCPFCSIMYTMDGSKPVDSVDQTYHGSHPLTNSVLVQSRAFKEGWEPSDITSNYIQVSYISKIIVTGAAVSIYTGDGCYSWVRCNENGDYGILFHGISDILGGSILKDFQAELTTDDIFFLTSPITNDTYFAVEYGGTMLDPEITRRFFFYDQDDVLLDQCEITEDDVNNITRNQYAENDVFYRFRYLDGMVHLQYVTNQ